MTTDGTMSTQPWRENASWVWDPQRNRDMHHTATLRVTVRSTATDLTASITQWLAQLEPDGDGVWLWGGFSCSPVALDMRAAVLDLSSSGEDAFESLTHASRWLHRDVVAAHQDVVVQWDELPLK